MDYFNPSAVSWANYFGASLSLIYGLSWLLFFSPLTEIFAIEPHEPRGVLELRSISGGFVAFISSFALVTGDPVTFRMLGFGWLGIPLVRLIFTPFDSDGFYLEELLWGRSQRLWRDGVTVHGSS